MIHVHPSPALLMPPGAARTLHISAPPQGQWRRTSRNGPAWPRHAPECTRAAMHLQCLLWHWPLQWCTSIAAMWRADFEAGHDAARRARNRTRRAQSCSRSDGVRLAHKRYMRSMVFRCRSYALCIDAVADDSGTRTAESVAHGYGAMPGVKSRGPQTEGREKNVTPHL